MQDHPWIKSYPEGLRWDVDLPVRPVQDIIDASAAQWPTLNAIAFFGILKAGGVVANYSPLAM